MSLNSYLLVEGERQGRIRGSSPNAERQDGIDVYGFSHEVVSPRDAATGLPTGKRQHRPISITKRIDKSSPLLMQALVTNESLTVVLRTFVTADDGSDQAAFEIELTNASISSIRTEQLNNKYPDNLDHEVREHVSFTYQRMMWPTFRYATAARSHQSDRPRKLLN